LRLFPESPSVSFVHLSSPVFVAPLSLPFVSSSPLFLSSEC
jgi:hypothetical protein